MSVELPHRKGALVMENSNGFAQTRKLKPYHDTTDTTGLWNKTKLLLLEKKIKSLETFKPSGSVNVLLLLL